jgi:benzoyl-CoA reductase/2-hydroxyglutaryl-CoA dehydratase subunit BcrC/BadD/HgdB
MGEMPLSPLLELVRDPHPRLRAGKESGREAIGYFCSYVPVELIHAAGFTPVRLLQGPAPGDIAGSFMQPFCCSFARSLLEGLGSGQYDYLSAVVMPHTCDTIRNLSDIVPLAIPETPVIRLMVPTITTTPEAEDFMLEELAAMQRELERIADREIGEDDLRASIGLYNRCRERGAELRSEGLSNHLLFAAYLALQLAGPEDFLAIAGTLVGSRTKHGAKRVAVVGGPVPQLEIFDLLEEYGMRVVWDDLCTGSRFVGGMVEEKAGGLRALAQRYLCRRPCPTKLAPGNERERELISGLSGSGAQAVIFAQQAFCEFHSFDYPGLKKRLDAEGIASVRLDLEHPFRPTGQMRTRLQALSEILEGM